MSVVTERREIEHKGSTYIIEHRKYKRTVIYDALHYEFKRRHPLRINLEKESITDEGAMLLIDVWQKGYDIGKKHGEQDKMKEIKQVLEIPEGEEYEW